MSTAMTPLLKSSLLKSSLLKSHSPTLHLVFEAKRQRKIMVNEFNEGIVTSTMRKQIEDLDLQTRPRGPGEAIEASSNERSQIDKEETGSLTGDKRGIWNPASGRTAVVEKPRYPSISHRIRENWMWDL
jgi:hypothetical protein